MADEDNIFLLASNFVSGVYTGKKGTTGFDYNENTPTKIGFTSIVNEYNANGVQNDIPQILSKLNNQSIYHKWMNKRENQVKDLNNEKAVCSILDVKLWEGYNNSTYASYTIGSPTFEMFCKSYNDSHTGTNLQSEETSSDYGYTMKTSGNDQSLYVVSDLNRNAKNSSVDEMLFKKLKTENEYYWLSSPAGYNLGNYILRVRI